MSACMKRLAVSSRVPPRVSRLGVFTSNELGVTFPRAKREGLRPRSALREPGDGAVGGDVHRLRVGMARQARHGLDIPGERHDEPGPR